MQRKVLIFQLCRSCLFFFVADKLFIIAVSTGSALFVLLVLLVVILLCIRHNRKSDDLADTESYERDVNFPNDAYEGDDNDKDFHKNSFDSRTYQDFDRQNQATSRNCSGFKRYQDSYRGDDNFQIDDWRDKANAYNYGRGNNRHHRDNVTESTEDSLPRANIKRSSKENRGIQSIDRMDLWQNNPYYSS